MMTFTSPVPLTTMDEIVKRFGPAPQACLLVTLAGALLVDLANAVVTKLFLLSPVFTPVPPAASG